MIHFKAVSEQELKTQPIMNDNFETRNLHKILRYHIEHIYSLFKINRSVHPRPLWLNKMKDEPLSRLFIKKNWGG